MSPVLAHRFCVALQTEASLLSRSSSQFAKSFCPAAASDSSSALKPVGCYKRAAQARRLKSGHNCTSSEPLASLPGCAGSDFLHGSPTSGTRLKHQPIVLSMGDQRHSVTEDDLKQPEQQQAKRRVSTKLTPLKVGGFSVEGISIGGHETCVMIPSMKMAFDVGRCPQRAISQDFLFISHAHMDHIGGIAMYVATRGLYSMKPPVVIVPSSIKSTVEKLMEVYRELDGSELALRLVGLDVGDEYDLGKGFVVKPFRTYHVVPSQGYVVYSIKKKLKPEFLHLSGPEIRDLKLSGVEIVNTTIVPEVAFTGDTTADFINDSSNGDALRAKLLIMEATFVDNAVSVAHARDYGHVHLSEVANLASRFKNENILLIHFSARYEAEEIMKAIHNLPPALKERASALLEGF